MKIFKRAGKIAGIIIAILIVIFISITIFHRISLRTEESRIVPIGQMVEVGGYMMHVYISGENKNAPLLVFLSGAQTPAPVFDFMPLYSLLIDEFRIVVVERFGYGYSDIADAPRDIDTVLSNTRYALYAVGETGPYIILPHSMSGLEALRWSQLYPDEVLGIIGLDKAVPSMYIAGYGTASNFTLWLMQAAAWTGIVSRFPPPGGLPIDALLGEQEREQNRLLTNRNNFNRVIVEEGRNVLENAKTVEAYGLPGLPILLMVAEKSMQQFGEFWIPHKEEFARQTGAEIEFFAAGHSIHHEKPERMAELIREFVLRVE